LAKHSLTVLTPPRTAEEKTDAKRDWILTATERSPDRGSRSRRDRALPSSAVIVSSRVKAKRARQRAEREAKMAASSACAAAAAANEEDEDKSDTDTPPEPCPKDRTNSEPSPGSSAVGEEAGKSKGSGKGVVVDESVVASIATLTNLNSHFAPSPRPSAVPDRLRRFPLLNRSFGALVPS
jgi:hypothetical protein